MFGGRYCKSTIRMSLLQFAGSVTNNNNQNRYKYMKYSAKFTYREKTKKMEEKECLAVKLDKELDDYVDDVLEKNKNYRYAHPLSEDNWEEVWLTGCLRWLYMN